MEGQEDSFLRKKASKYGGLWSLATAMVNVSLGAWLAWTYVHYPDHTCETQVGLFMIVAGITSLVYGFGFTLYAIYAAVKFCRRSGYAEIEDDGAQNLVQATRPNGCVTCTMFLLFLVGIFRLAWLIFGSVEVFKVVSCSSHAIYQAAFVYIIIQWSLIGAFCFVICLGVCTTVCCAAMLASG